VGPYASALPEEDAPDEARPSLFAVPGNHDWYDGLGAFMGLFAAMVSEHIGLQWERKLLYPALVLGVASVLWWRYADDLRVYVWVQGAPLLAIPLVIVLFPARFSHRHYLLTGLAFYAAAKVAEYLDKPLYDLLFTAISGHSLKHLIAALAPLMLLLMLQRRNSI